MMMNKDEVVLIANKNNGYLFSKIIKENNIPTVVIGRLVKDGVLTKVARGIYITNQGIEDQLYVASIKYSRIIFSGDTALFLNGLSNKQSPGLEYTVPFGTCVPKIEGFDIKYCRNENKYALGMIYIKTPFGNAVRCYDKERCICDLFIRPDYYDYEDRIFAINEYKNRYLNFKKLYNYAEKLGVYEKVKNLFEVIGWN